MEYNNPNVKKEKLINENTTNYYEFFNTINLKNMTYLNKGSCAKIYYNKRIILKKYYAETPINLRIKEDIFNILKDINSRNFIELYDIYSTYKENLNQQSITSAYTAKYYKDNSINPILENKNYLLENNIPEEKIIMDPAGVSTYDSIFRVQKQLKAKKIIIVSQKYHLYRALYIANSLGIEAYGVPADDIKYKGATYREVREILARNKDFIKSIISFALPEFA